MNQLIELEFGPTTLRLAMPVEKVQAIVTQAELLSKIRSIIGELNVPDTLRRLDGFAVQDDTRQIRSIDQVRLSEMGVKFLINLEGDVVESAPLFVKDLAAQFAIDFDPVPMPRPNRIVIELVGGVVKRVVSSVPIDYVVYDRDTEGHYGDEDKVLLVSDIGRMANQVEVVDHGINETEVNRQMVNAAFQVYQERKKKVLCPQCLMEMDEVYPSADREVCIVCFTRGA